MNWYKVANKNKQKDFFIKRTKNHIRMVQNNVKKIVQKYPEFSDLIEQAKKHDNTKFEEPEMSPYISLTWRKNPNVSEKDKTDLLSKEKENEATLHHVKNNSHHPEYHLEDKDDANIDSNNRDKSEKCVGASLMPDIDIAEMVSDWQAVSEELGTNTAREWFEKQKNVRWHFSKKQEKLIDKLIGVFE